MTMRGPLHRFFAADHRRLDALLTRAVAGEGVARRGCGRDGPEVLQHIRANLELSRRQWQEDNQPR